MEIINRKARYDYIISDVYECGIVLKGTEIKSIRNGQCNLKDSYGIVKNGEIFLLNMFIAKYKEASIFNSDENRTRKLLLHKSEIKKISNDVKLSGMTIVPLKLYFKGSNVKVEIGVCKGKKQFDKRETIKERDLLRESNKSMKNRY